MKRRQMGFLAICLLIGGLLTGWTHLAQAETDTVQPPEELIEFVTQRMIETIHRHKIQLEVSPERLQEIILTVVEPHIDFTLMSKWVLGRQAWLGATPKKRQAFEQVFKKLLVRTYANVVLEYIDETFTYQPVRGDYLHKKRVQVQGTLTQPSGDPVAFVYRLVRHEQSWQLYDVVIEGVSLLQGMKVQFEHVLQHDGLDALIEQLREKNQQAVMPQQQSFYHPVLLQEGRC